MRESGAAPPSLFAVLRGAWVEAPGGVRAGLAGILVTWLMLAALQVWDVSGRSGPDVFAELTSVLAGSCGTFLFVAAGVLDVAGVRSEAAQLAGAERVGAVRQMLLALPIVSFASAVLLGIAVGIAVVRIRLGSWPGLLGLLFWSTMLFLCGRAIADSSRALWQLARRQGEAAARAEGEAAEARLAALQSQLNPHFLFNALNTVADLLRSDVVAAERCVEGLGSVLRRTLDRGAKGTVRDEIEYLGAYLEIESLRLGDRLAVSWLVDEDALEARLPPMTLQPLVENALRHGIGQRIDGGRVAIGAAADRERLRVWVEDDGAGFPSRVVEGVGLSNLRARLETRYGRAAGLRIEGRAPGSRVTVELPLERGEA